MNFKKELSGVAAEVAKIMEAELSKKQKEIAKMSAPHHKIDAGDLAKLRAGHKPVKEEQEQVDEMNKTGATSGYMLRADKKLADKVKKAKEGSMSGLMKKYGGKTGEEISKMKKEEVDQIDESDLPMGRAKDQKTITVKHKTSGKELKVVDTPSVREKYKKMDYHPMSEEQEQVEEAAKWRNNPKAQMKNPALKYDADNDWDQPEKVAKGDKEVSPFSISNRTGSNTFKKGPKTGKITPAARDNLKFAIKQSLGKHNRPNLPEEVQQVVEGIEDKIEAAREKAAAAGKPMKEPKKEVSAKRKVEGPRYGGGKQKDEVEESTSLPFTSMLEAYDEHGLIAFVKEEMVTEGDAYDKDRYAVKNGKAVKDNPSHKGSPNYKDQPHHVWATSAEHALQKKMKEEVDNETFKKEMEDQKASMEGKKKQPSVAAPSTQGVKNMDEEIEVVDLDQVNGVSIENIEERTLSEPEMKKREDYVKGMKKKLSGFKQRYGERAKEVMYATATKMAKKD